MSIDADQYGDSYSRTGDSKDAPRTEAPSSGRDASAAAARLLEVTARETEQWRSEARNEAAAIVARARDEADRLVGSARDQATQITGEARAEAARVREETAALRQRHEQEIARLEQVATEQRELLGRHLTDLLDRVNSVPRVGDQ